MKKKEEENGKSYLAEFAYGDSLGISVFDLNIGRLFSTSWEYQSSTQIRPSFQQPLKHFYRMLKYRGLWEG
jgi:hypothetical protein